MRKIFFLCLCVFCLAVSLRPAAAFAATTTSSAAIANPMQFWSDLLALQQMIQGILTPYTGHTLPGPLGGGSTLILQNANNSASLAIYLGILDAFYKYFMLYIAAPGFVALMLWFFYDYTRRLSKGDANAAMYFIHRALIILLTAILLFPAQEMVGVSDTRPTAVWLVTEGTEAGMELAGLAVKTGYAGIEGIVAAPVPSTSANTSGGFWNFSDWKNSSVYKFWSGNAQQSSAQQQEVAGSALLTQQISTIQASCGTNDMCYFLSLPYTLEGFIQQDAQNVAAFQKQYHAMLQTNPQAAANEMHMANAQKKKDSVSEWTTIVIGVLLGLLSIITGMALTALPIAATVAGMAGVKLGIIANLPIIFGDIFFFLAFGIAFYFAVLSIMFKTLAYAALGVMQAFMLPFGKWGSNKIVAYLSNIIAFFLAPTLLSFVWFVGLVARDMYVMLMHVIPDYLLAAGPGSQINVFMYLITFLALSTAFILPLCLALTRTSNYLSHIIGNVFQSGLSADARFRTLMAK